MRNKIKAVTGFDIMENDTTFKSIKDILVGIGKEFENLDDISKSSILETLGGKRASNALAAVLNNYKMVEEAYETSVNSSGSAKREQEAYAQSVQYSIDRAKASLEELANDFLSSDLLKGLIDAGNTALRIVDSLVQKLGSVGSIITALGGLSTIKGLLGADSVVGSLVKGVAEKYTGKNLGNSLVKNIGELFSSADFGKALGGFGKNVVGSIVGKEATEAVTDWTTDVVGAATSSITEVGSEVVGGLLTSTEKQFDVLSDSTRNMSTEAAEAVSKTMGEWTENVVSDGISDEMWDTFIDGGSEAFDEVSDDFAKYVHDRAVGDAVKETLGEASEEAIGEGIEKGAKAATASAGKTVAKEMADDVGKGAADMYETVTRSAADFADEAFQFAGPAMSGASSAGAAAGETFMSAFLGALNPATIAIAAVGVGTAVGVAWYQGYRKEIERQKQEGTSQWEQDKKNIQEYMQSYQELHDKLDDKTLTESEQIGIKEQILSLQHQILESYGEEAANIDLVNGELQEQMGILEGIATKRASDNLMENRNGYEDAKKAMTSKVDRTIVDTDALLTSQSDKMKDLIGEINKIDGLNAGIIKDYNGFDQFKIDINYDDVSSAVEGLNQLQSLLDTTIKKSPHDKSFLQDVNSIKDWVFGQGDGIFDLKGVRDIFDTYSKNKSVYDAYLEQTFAEKGGFKIVNAMEQAVSDYNKAVSSMDVEELDKQSKQVTQTISDVESFAKKNGFESWQYQDKIDMAQAKMDSEGANLLYAQNALEVATGKSKKLADTSPFEDDIEDITDYISKLKELGMSTVDVEDTLDKLSRTKSIDGLSAGQKAILNLATTFGIASTEGKTLSDILANLGIVKTGDQVTQGQEQAPYIDITDTKSKYKAAMQSIDSINSALVNSFSGKGLTYNWDKESGEFINDMDNIVKSFPDLSVNTAALFKRTANGIKINTEELRKLESQQQKITKQGFYKEQEKALKKLNEAKLKAAEEGRDINTDTNVEQARKAVEQIQYMIAAYDGATSAYQNWLEVAQQGEEGDMYDNIRSTALTRGDELLKEGLVGTEEFRAIAQLMSGKDLSTAGIDEVISSFQGIDDTIDGTSKTVRSFFEDGEKGVTNFADAMSELGYVTKIAEGEYEANDEPFDVEEVAERIGTSVDVIESALHKLKDYGLDVSWFTDEQLAQLDVCDEKIQNIAKDVEKANETEGVTYTYSVDVENLNDIESIDAEIANLQHLLSGTTSMSLNYEQYRAYSALLDELINKRNILAGYDPSQGITSSSIQAGDAAFEDAIARFQAAADKGVTINIEGDEELQRDAQILAKLPPELKTKYGFEADADAQEILEVLQGKVKPVDQKLEAPAGTVSTDNVVQTEQTTNATVNVEANTEEAEKSVENFTEDVESEPVTKKVKTEYTSEEKSEMAKDTSTESIRQEMISIHSEYDSSGSDQAKQAISEIPNEKDVEINAEATGVDEASAEIDNAAQSRQANIEVSATGDTTGVSDQEVTVTENFVKGDQQEPDPKPADVNYELEGQEEPLPKTSHVYYNWAGQSDPHDATAQLHYEGILTTLPTIIQTVQLHYTGGAGLPVAGRFAGTAQVGRSAISSFYGAAHASGNWGTRRTEKALLAELGPEILVNPHTGKWELVGEDGPVMQTVPKGSIIFNHEQSEELLKYGHTAGRARASITLGTGGDSFLGGTAHGTKSSFSGKIGGNRDQDKSDGGDTYNVDTYNNYESGSDSKKDSGSSDDSSSDDAKEDVKELFDWIEVKMERLTTRIKVAATTAGSAFESFADRLKANAKQIKTIKIKEENNDEAVKEYRKASRKARKGLSKKYVKKVRNGTIDIEEIKNEKLKDKITKYQDAYNKYYEAKYVTPGELKQERLEAVSSRFDMIQSKYEGKIDKRDNRIERYQKNQELREEKGLLPSIKNYKAQIKETDDKKKDLLAEQEALKKQLKKAIQDGIAKDSEKYREMEEAVEAVGIALKDADIDAQKLKNDINKAYLARFEKHNEEGESKTGDLEYEQKKIEDNDALRVAKGKNKSLSNNKALRKNAQDQVKTGKTILKQLRADYKNFLKGGGLPDSDEGKKMIDGIRSWEEEIRSDIQRYVDLGNEALDIIVDDLSDVQDNINFKRLMNDQNRQARANKQSLREAQGLLPSVKSYQQDLKSNETDRKLNNKEISAIKDSMKKYLQEGGKSTDKAYRDMKEQVYSLRRENEQSLLNDEEIKTSIKDFYVSKYNKKTEGYEQNLSDNEFARKQLQQQQDTRVAQGELESTDIVKDLIKLAESDKKNKQEELVIAQRLRDSYLNVEGHSKNDSQYKALDKNVQDLTLDIANLDKSVIDYNNDLKRIYIEQHERNIEDLDYNYDLKNHELEMLKQQQSKRNAIDLLNSVTNFNMQNDLLYEMGDIIYDKIQETVDSIKNYVGSKDDKEYKDLVKELNSYYEEQGNNDLAILENQNAIKQAYVDKFNRQADRFDANSAKFDHDINMLRAKQDRLARLDKDEDPEIYNEIIDLTKQKIENEMTRIQKLRETLAEYLASGGSTEDDNYRSMASALYSAEEGVETLINSLYELDDAATNTAVTRFNKNKNRYDAQIEALEYMNSILDARQENRELNGALPLEEFYERQRENTSRMIELSMASFEQMKRDMENFISLGGDTASDEYMNMLSSLRAMGKSVVDLTNNLDELDKKIRDIAVERFKNTNEFYDFLLSGNEHTKNTLENDQSLLTSNGDLASVDNYEKMIDADNERLAILAKKREHMVKNMAEYLAAPGAKESDEDYRDMVNTLNELDEAAQQTEIDISNLNNEIRSVYTERFNKIAEDFGNQISLIEHKTNEINNTLSLIEARGHFVTKSLYDSLVGGSIEQMDKLKAEFDELTAARDEAFESGKIEKYGNEWYAFQNALSDVNEKYQEAYLNAVKFRKELEKLNWEKFDFLQNQISDISDEAQFMIDLLSHKDLFDDDGIITNEGMATIGLYTERYHILTEQLAEYADEIARLDSVIEENPGDKEYIERRQELVKARRDMILTIENEKDSIKSLVEDGIQKELDSLRELIDAYVDAMDSAKDLYDYQKRIKKQTDEIAKLRKRLAAYSGDTSEENKARVQKITVDLEEALDELEETQYEHYISEQKKMLDDLYDQYEKLLNDRLDDIEALMKDMLSMVNSNGIQIAETIRSAAIDSKYGITSTINAVWSESIWNSGGEGESIISNISDAVAHGVQETITIVNSIFESVNDDILPALHALDKDPIINVEPAKVEVNVPDPDTSEFVDKLQEISDKISLIVNDASNASSSPKEEYSFSAHDDGYHPREDVEDHIVEDYSSEEQNVTDGSVVSLQRQLEDIRNTITNLQNKQWSAKDLTTNKSQTFGEITSLDRQLDSLFNEASGNKDLQREIASLNNTLASFRKRLTSMSQTYSESQPAQIVEEYSSVEQTASDTPAYSNPTSSITLNTYQVKTDPYGNNSRVDPSYYGQPVFVTDVKSNADYPYQVSADPYGNNVIGWVRKMNLKGYANGAKVINSDQFAWTQENDPETIVRKSDHAVLTRLGRGDRIYNALASDRLWTAANDPMKYLTDAVGMSTRVNMDSETGTSVGDIVYNITIPIEHVQDYNDFVNQLRSDGKFEKMVQSMTIDRIAGKSRLAKNKYQW